METFVMTHESYSVLKNPAKWTSSWNHCTFCCSRANTHQPSAWPGALTTSSIPLPMAHAAFSVALRPFPARRLRAVPLCAASPPPLSPASAAHADSAARDFLTQRAAQTVMFISRALRDETSAKWLDRFFGGNLEDAHIADALRNAQGERAHSSAQLRELLRAPNETIHVRKPVVGRGGSTATNPHIKKRYFEYDVNIRPRAIGRRVLSVRAAIAEELQVDLALMQRETDRLWRAFRAAVERGDALEAIVRTGDRVDLSLLDVGAYAGVEEAGGTPYRVANFDLAQSLSLAIATQIVIKSSDEGGIWLAEFCADRVPAMLRPPRGIRRAADGFVAALLAQAPVLRDGAIARDPMLLCERVLETRLAVCRVWVDVCQVVSEEHLELEKELLEGSLNTGGWYK